jgi:hypothetical protein
LVEVDPLWTPTGPTAISSIILSVGFHTLPEARAKVKPLLADRLDVALEASEQGGTALCEQGRRIA